MHNQALPGSSAPMDGMTGGDSPAVQFKKLKPTPEMIDCPNCRQHTQTAVQGRSEGTKKFMNVFWWPFPNRTHWFEETKWFCGNCNHPIATQKHGKNIQVLV